MDNLFERLRMFLTLLGPDVKHKARRSFHSFSHDTGKCRRNFTYVHRYKSYLRANVRRDLALDSDFVVEHHGRINHRAIKIRNARDLERAMPLLRQCYESAD